MPTLPLAVVITLQDLLLPLPKPRAKVHTLSTLTPATPLIRHSNTRLLINNLSTHTVTMIENDEQKMKMMILEKCPGPLRPFLRISTMRSEITLLRPTITVTQMEMVMETVTTRTRNHFGYPQPLNEGLHWLFRHCWDHRDKPPDRDWTIWVSHPSHPPRKERPTHLSRTRTMLLRKRVRDKDKDIQPSLVLPLHPLTRRKRRSKLSARGRRARMRGV